MVDRRNKKRIAKNIQLHQNKSIPTKATILSSEDIAFTISYTQYNDKICEMKDLGGNRARAFLQLLRKMGKATSMQDFKSLNIDCYPVYYTGEYTKLFSGLPEDVELKEHKIQIESRLFYHIVGSKVYIVCIKNSHLETDKQRK